MMSRNPWALSWLTGDVTEDGDDERYSVDDQVAYLERIWSEAVEDADHGSELDRAILRIRWGARAACRRLRAERDDARANYRFMVERACDEKLDGYRELGARAAAAENDLDTARRELAALEWLVFDCRLFLERRADGSILLTNADDSMYLIYADVQDAAAAHGLDWKETDDA